MQEIISNFWLAVYFLIIPFAANAFPPLSKGRIPIDRGKLFVDGRRILGDGKTVEGFVFGMAGGIMFTYILSKMYDAINITALSFGFSVPRIELWQGAVVAFFSLLGDVAGSFIKRRVGLERGAKFPVLDQLDFVVGAVVAYVLFFKISLLTIFFMCAIAFVIHRAGNIVGFVIKVKRVPW